jgi:hypothetical protein
MALRLKEVGLIRRSIESVPLREISIVSRSIPLAYLGTLLVSLTGFLEDSPHLEFLLEWCQVGPPLFYLISIAFLNYPISAPVATHHSSNRQSGNAGDLCCTR